MGSWKLSKSLAYACQLYQHIQIFCQVGFKDFVMHYEYDVVLATYNGENYIDEQLYSIVNQSIPPSKIIISDDSSRDKSLSICNYWSTQSLIPFLILPQPSCRLGSCRNFERLLTFSSSNYVMLADQDDIWDLNKAENI